MNHFLAATIRLYQQTLSPDHGLLRAITPRGVCRFYPTCSEYSRQAILTHGTVHGLVLSLRRIVHCHPWSAGGVDLIPPHD